VGVYRWLRVSRFQDRDPGLQVCRRDSVLNVVTISIAISVGVDGEFILDQTVSDRISSLTAHFEYDMSLQAASEPINTST